MSFDDKRAQTQVLRKKYIEEGLLKTSLYEVGIPYFHMVKHVSFDQDILRLLVCDAYWVIIFSLCWYSSPKTLYILHDNLLVQRSEYLTNISVSLMKGICTPTLLSTHKVWVI